MLSIKQLILPLALCCFCVIGASPLSHAATTPAPATVQPSTPAPTTQAPPTQAASNSASTALQTTKKLVQLFGQVIHPKNPNATLSAAQQQQNTAIYQQLDQYIDFHLITTKPLAKHKGAFSSSQMQTVKSQFKEAIREAAYPKAGKFLNKADIKYGKVIGNKTQSNVPVTAYDPNQDVDISLVFHWAYNNGQWKLVDLSIDDASLVQDYENQFSRIIKKHGAQGLIDRIQKKLNTLHSPPTAKG